MKSNFVFNVSLSVLNHLGRNLYRNIITVLGEAISNSWDADANNVFIVINKENNWMTIGDDGEGMTDDDFQNKFLKIGYSKRKNGKYKTNSGRPFIGRKGIGKLALLSCAERVHIASKTKETELVGGIIDNSLLDKAITDDLNSQEYSLEHLNKQDVISAQNLKNGTYILFENVNVGISNTIEYLKKAIAYYFRFSLIDSNFKIFVNNELIDVKNLKDLAEETQFLWNINSFNDPYFSLLSKNIITIPLTSNFNIRGYFATTIKPSNLKIRGTQEKVTVDLFVNGRHREKDILRHIPSTRIVENYVYGQIHFDDLDVGESKDIFTSSREGVIADDSKYGQFINEIQRLFKLVITKWDELRLDSGNDGDPENNKYSTKERKAIELFNASFMEMKIGQERHGHQKLHNTSKIVDFWIKQLSEDASYNIPSYVDCFVAENLLRKYIEYKHMPLSKEAKKEANNWRTKEKNNKGKANISYEIRRSTEDIYYLDMSYLSNFVDKAQNKENDAALSRSACVYKPVRDAVGHTSLITSTAKNQLSLELENIKARVMDLLKDVK
ncbi:ATP-binding protein [Succinivibrio dextrinosolvens]|uniref:ATP-binding protein n=1 Tax=Succinivibrio dextrinosolvens TaxID=83771 RepID=UPI002479132B|nr:ATP-binding protein [Succinivibrio dextrinosolvens]